MVLGAPRRAAAARPALPHARGPISAHVLDLLAGRSPAVVMAEVIDGLGAVVDPIGDEDLQLALYCLYELHYRGFADVDDAREWDLDLLRIRGLLEARFEAALLPLGQRPDLVPDVPSALQELIDTWSSPSLSRYAAEEATREQVRELAVHRSAYQLKEADPHTWGIPRLSGRPKAAMIEIQFDEYGGGVSSQMHSQLFADTMAALDLDNTYGAYLDLIPARTLATVNLISLFGLHRRLRGELVGHLAVFEMTSVVPMGRYSEALRRHGIGQAGRRFYDVHVEADARHQVIAATSLAGALAADEPALAPAILAGARMLMAVEERFARHLLDSWAAGRSSLLRPIPTVSEARGRSLAV